MAGALARTGLGLLVLVGPAVGCPKGPPVRASYRGGTEPPAAGDTAEVAAKPEPERDPQVVARMHAAFDAVDKVHEALEKGDLPEAVKEGQALRASVETQEIPASWEPHLQRFDAAAAALIEADDPAEASARAAELVAACGGCHAALQATVVLPEPEEPAGPDAPMQLHAWAVKRMWEGLVMPSEDRFLRGTATLALLPTCERDPERCQRFRQVVQRSHVAQTDEQRVELYGRLLATCSDCHRATAGGP